SADGTAPDFSFFELETMAAKRSRRLIGCYSWISVHGVVLGDHPLAFFILKRNREEFFIGAGLARGVAAFAAIMQNAQRRRIFPIDYLPGNQRVLCFGFTDKGGILLAVVPLPVSELFVAVSIAHGVQVFGRQALGGSVAQRVERDGVGCPGKRIAI